MRSFIVLAQGGSSRGKERKIDYEEKRVWDKWRLSNVSVADDEVERNEEILWILLIGKLIMNMIIRKKSTDKSDEK